MVLRSIFPPASVLLAVAIAAPGVVRAEVTLGSLLEEMTDLDSVARWPQPEFTCQQASSYDRGTVAPDQPGWFANNDRNQFIRTETVRGRTEKVMLDADGPGCIVRFWLTTDHNKRGKLRIYLDGGAEPSLTFPAYDLLSGDLGIGPPLVQPHPGYQPGIKGGSNFYLPMPYSRHCKVTLEETGDGLRYYQINCRTYEPGTEVRTFTRAGLDALRPMIGQVSKALESPPDQRGGVQTVMDLQAGVTRTLELPQGPAALRWLELQVPPDLSEQALRSVVLQMNCDGERTIWCPVSDFFGSGVGLNEVRSWYRTVTVDGKMVCRWVMPYRKSASVSLTNHAPTPVTVTLTTTTTPWKWDGRSMHFRTSWHHEARLATPPERDWDFTGITGRGVYVGDTLAIFNPVATWYGEGDEKIWVDGEKFPSHMGTGTEDYYGYSFAPQPVHQTPFCGEPRIDQPMTQGHSTSTRTRNLDGIPFRKSLRFDLELIPWKPMAPTYAATAHWYAFPGATTKVAPTPDGAALDMPTLADLVPHKPGAIECESMKLLAKSADFFTGAQDMEPFGGDRWSNGQQLLAKTTAIGDSFEIEIPCPDNARRKLVLFATRAPDFATLRFQVNQQKVASTFDGHADTVQPAPPFDLGLFAPRNGKFTLRVEVTGAHPASTGAKYFVGLDCVIPEKP